MTGEELDEDTIMSLFEAARWAPSSYNNQPWRFIYAKRNTLHWDKHCSRTASLSIRTAMYT
jgi:nitroreductase